MTFDLSKAKEALEFFRSPDVGYPSELLAKHLESALAEIERQAILLERQSAIFENDPWKQLAALRAALIREGHQELCGLLIGDNNLCSDCREDAARAEAQRND